MSKTFSTIDGNEAAARIAYQLSEVCAIYPITPSSPMGELCDVWSSNQQKNLWGNVPEVIQMQSEAGVAGAIHGILQSGSLATTFTSSQGLLLLIPDMYKIAGELLPTVFHIAARTIATHALSIFGDHSDVMAARMTGWTMLCSDSIQSITDLAAISYASTLESRIPVLHFFDGFRSSHEVMKIEDISKEQLRRMINDEFVFQFRNRALTPDNPVTRGTSQNPDVFFQARETINPFYDKCPEIVSANMKKFKEIAGREYQLFEYYGDPEAERIIIIMGSAALTVKETIADLNMRDEKTGFINVRLYRPFSLPHFIGSIPKSCKKIAVLDRTKEPGALGEPLYEDVMSAFQIAYKDRLINQLPFIVGGRYGLSSKEFRPCMVKAIFDELKKEEPKNHFTVGINDDVSFNSLVYDEEYTLEDAHIFRGKFYGLGADGTVGANKNSIKIIGEKTDFYVQGYFEYDSKKSGSYTISHIRFGENDIKSTYLIEKPNFVACHQQQLIEKMDMLSTAEVSSTFLLNTSVPRDKVWDSLPYKFQKVILEKNLKFFAIDAYKIAIESGMGTRINTIMQTCFFAISNIIPAEKAIEYIKDTIYKTYSSKGEKAVELNNSVVDLAIGNLYEVKHGQLKTYDENEFEIFKDSPLQVQQVCAKIIHSEGNTIPVSAFPVDGTFVVGTTKLEKRNIAQEVPVWDVDLCIQCNKCVLVCPHAAIRAKVFDSSVLNQPPATFKHTAFRGKDFGENIRYNLQVAVEDCTGCGICVDVCPATDKENNDYKAINMQPQAPIRENERENFNYFLKLPEVDRNKLKINTVKFSQFLQPLFEFSGACAGCGETPYIKLITQLFGDRALIANATGCSSIYGGNLPSSPWTTNVDGRGPAWANSLFEDNAEFGLGFRTSLDKKNEIAKNMVIKFASEIGENLAKELVESDQTIEIEIFKQRERVQILKEKIKNIQSAEARHLLSFADYLVKKSVWIFGGDGWAYDIGFGGLDHVMASGRNVNILVLDTEVYSNTGGQTSKATPRASVARFSSSGKKNPKKDLGLMMMNYNKVYVASVAFGSNDAQTVKSILEAEAFDGPSLIIAYSHCIAHGIDDMALSLHHQKAAVDSGYWILYRYNPELIKKGANPFTLDSKTPKISFSDFAQTENRYKILSKANPSEKDKLMELAQNDINIRWRMYQSLSANFNPKKEEVEIRN